MRFIFGFLFLSTIGLAQKSNPITATLLNSPVKEKYLKFEVLKNGKNLTGAKVKISENNNGKSGKTLFDFADAEIENQADKIIVKYRASHLTPKSYFAQVKVIETSLLIKKDEHIAKSVAGDVHQKFAIDSSLSVADPGEVGLKTLLGIDTNNNGIRDDVERFIYENYPKGSNEATHLELDYLKNYKVALEVDENDKVKREAYSESISLNLDCSLYLLNNSYNTIARLNEKFRPIVFNTKERIIKNMKFNSSFHGDFVVAKPKNVITGENFNEKCR